MVLLKIKRLISNKPVEEQTKDLTGISLNNKQEWPINIRCPCPLVIRETKG